MNEKVIASVIGFAIGDAVGVPAEFKSRETLKKSPVTDMSGYGTHNMPPGTWSDDTSMMLATMDSVIEKESFDYDDIMTKFIKWFKEGEYTATGETFDIGITTHDALNRYSKNHKYTKCGSNSFYDNGNGSLMRILPLAIYDAVVRPDEKELTEKVYYLSSITHGHEISLLGCRIYCDLYTELLKGKTIRDACAALQSQVYERYYDCLDCYRRILDGSIPDAGEDDVRSSGYVVDSLEAAVWCLANSSSYEECVLRAVNLGKDTDTIAAIAGSLAPLIFGAESIPKKWSERLLRADMINEMANEYLKVVLKIKEGREGK